MQTTETFGAARLTATSAAAKAAGGCSPACDKNCRGVCGSNTTARGPQNNPLACTQIPPHHTTRLRTDLPTSQPHFCSRHAALFGSIPRRGTLHLIGKPHDDFCAEAPFVVPSGRCLRVQIETDRVFAARLLQLPKSYRSQQRRYSPRSENDMRRSTGLSSHMSSHPPNFAVLKQLCSCGQIVVCSGSFVYYRTKAISGWDPSNVMAGQNVDFSLSVQFSVKLQTVYFSPLPGSA